MHQLSPTLRGPPNIILTSLLSSVWLALPLNFGIFCLHGRELLATGLMFACGLMKTLGITVCCNTTCSVKYVCLLVTTFGVAIRCNINIRLESVHCTLMTSGQVFVCYSATTLDTAIRFDTSTRPKSLRYVLAVIRLLPICRAHLR